MQEFCQRQNKSYFLKSLILNKPIKKLRKPIKAPKRISCQPSTRQSHNWINEWLMAPTLRADIIMKTEEK